MSDADFLAHVKVEMAAMLAILKKAMDEGPGGEPAVLTPAQATLAYRLIMER